MKPSRASVRARDAATERSIQEAKDAAHAEMSAMFAANKAAFAARNKPVPFTREELEAATAIRTSYGWERVVKVNAKSVKIAAAPGWDDLVRIEKILEVRT